MNVSGVPATVEEYDAMAKQAGAAHERAVDADFQHDWNGRWRKSFCEALEKLTGVERKKEEKDNKVKFLETENVYIARVESETATKYPVLAQEIADKTEYRTQGSGGGSIGEVWFGEADGIIAAVGGNSWDGFVANITNNNPGFVFDFDDETGKPTRESVALALKTEDSREKALAKAKRLALVGA